MYCDCKCSVALPRSGVGWSACVIVAFSDLTHLRLCTFGQTVRISFDDSLLISCVFIA